MAGLPDKRECHPDRRPHAQPRVTAIVPTRRRDGGQTDTRSGTGHNFRVTRTAHSTHRQTSMFGAPPGSRAAYLACPHRPYTPTLRCEMSSRAGQSLMKSCFPAVYLGVRWRSHYRLPRRPQKDYAALLSHQPRPDNRKMDADPDTAAKTVAVASPVQHGRCRDLDSVLAGASRLVQQLGTATHTPYGHPGQPPTPSSACAVTASRSTPVATDQKVGGSSPSERASEP